MIHYCVHPGVDLGLLRQEHILLSALPWLLVQQYRTDR
jgi:hypothetical protein